MAQSGPAHAPDPTQAEAGPPQSAGSLRPSLGPLAVTAQAVATVGLTLTAVINIPEAMRGAGRATWISYALALALILLVSETLVLCRRLPAGPRGIAGYVEAGLGSRPAAAASWILLLGYGATLMACLAFLGYYIVHGFAHLSLTVLPVIAFLLGGLICVLLARRDVKLSTHTMLVTESISVLIVLALTLLVLRHGGPAQDWRAMDPVGDRFLQVRSGLMVAVLSFIGFESAANLGGETLRPDRVVTRAMRGSVLLAGALFTIWAMFLPEGLAWLPPAQRLGLDPLSDLADRLGWAGAGEWIRLGAFLCLFGTCLGSLNAVARLAYGLARERVLPARLAVLHPRFGTPSTAMTAMAVPVMGGGAVAVLKGLSASQMFDLFGGFSVLAFLLVYGLVAVSCLLAALPGCSRRRRLLVASSCLLALVVVAIAYLSGVLGQQNAMLASFVALVAGGVLQVWRVVPARSSLP